MQFSAAPGTVLPAFIGMVTDSHSERWHRWKRLYVTHPVAKWTYDRYINPALTAEPSLSSKILKHNTFLPYLTEIKRDHLNYPRYPMLILHNISTSVNTNMKRAVFGHSRTCRRLVDKEPAARST